MPKMAEKSKMTENTEVAKTPKVDHKPKIAEYGYCGTAQNSSDSLLRQGYLWSYSRFAPERYIIQGDWK